ncbi:MAG: hypothetical protein ABSE39_08800 [Candidatus Bathyarchaeia archaeon]
MPLLIRPVKMNKSIYVRVPNDIAHIIGLDNQVEVSFSFEDIGNELRLIYSLNKSKLENHQSSGQREINDRNQAAKSSPPNLPTEG